MPDIETWTPEDDALVRKALESLRADSDTIELSDPRLIRARGEGRRRRTLLSWTAGAAAAAIVAATVGYAAMGRDGATPVPPATSSTAAGPTTTGPRDLLKTVSALPLGEEWQQVLGLPAPAAVQPQPDYEGNICSTAEPGTRRRGPARGTRRRPAGRHLPRSADLLHASSRRTRQVPARRTSRRASRSAPPRSGPGSDSASGPAAQWPRIWSYTKDGRTGWLAIAQYGTAVAWLEIAADPPQGPAADQADMTALAHIAQQRLQLHGGAVIPKPARHHAASAGAG